MPADELVLDFSSSAASLSLSLGRLRVRRPGENDVFVPLGDVAIAVVGNHQVSFTGGALAGLMRFQGALVICDDNQYPVGMMLPIAAATAQTQRIAAQVDAPKPLRKRLWRQIVTSKIKAQAFSLRVATGDDAGLGALARRVRSGDAENVESTAAQRYWPRVFGDVSFRRRREAADQNRFLNYGYAVLRAAVGRAVCAAGLHPSIPIHHHGRHNPWVLADDLMEPYRPLVDDEVVAITGELGGDIAMTPDVKRRLIEILHARLAHHGAGSIESRTVFDWIGRTASSLAAIYTAEKPDPGALFFPTGLWREPSGH